MTDGRMTQAEGVSLREYFDQRFAESQRSIDKAEHLMEQRLAGMNEFRDTLRDQASRFVTREEMLAAIKALPCVIHESRVSSLDNWRARMEGVASQRSVMVTGALAVAGLIMSALALVLAWVRVT
ncbi:MAG: hypothetical protein A2Y78_04795 [Acidobacteria bacterium RBG_13_68_16]|nr:MAG: hypothetical protein A2Y78_04795 [Acidobacteria bacterium RBG_13_68_16]